jgi:hypothetical protein
MKRGSWEIIGLVVFVLLVLGAGMIWNFAGGVTGSTVTGRAIKGVGEIAVGFGEVRIDSDVYVPEVPCLSDEEIGVKERECEESCDDCFGSPMEDPAGEEEGEGEGEGEECIMDVMCEELFFEEVEVFEEEEILGEVEILEEEEVVEE